MKKSTLIGVIIVLAAIVVVCCLLYTSEKGSDCAKIPSKAEESMVWIKYTATGRNEDGTYFERMNTGSGIIYSMENSKMMILTNRHIVDCHYADEGCYQRSSEIVDIKTKDEKTRQVTKIFYALHSLDLALLEVEVINPEDYKIASLKINHIKLGEKVIAVGYPNFARETTECSVTQGKITGIKELLTIDGFKFVGIASDAYAYYGSSGGGLFDKEGNLIGITTWLSKNKEDNIAIGLDTINRSDLYIYCEDGYPEGEKCTKYCSKESALGRDQCYYACDGFYCESDSFGTNITCESTETICHFPCGSITTLCESNNYCYKNKCISCPTEMILYKDGKCRYSE